MFMIIFIMHRQRGRDRPTAGQLGCSKLFIIVLIEAMIIISSISIIFCIRNIFIALMKKKSVS